MSEITAVLGGSFDPVHLGHIDIARQLLARFDFKELLLVPAYRNPLKAGTNASTDDRIKLLELALGEANEPRLKVYDWEARRAAPSFTVDTLEQLQKTHGQLALAVGNEVFAQFTKWRAPLKIFSLANVVVFSRTPDVQNPCEEVLESLGITVAWEENRAELPDGNWIEWVPLTVLPYSSTEIRSQLLEGKTPAGLGSAPLRFIKDQGLYAE